MFDHVEIGVLPSGPRYAAQVWLRINGEDMVERAVGAGGRGPYAADVLPAGRPSPLRAIEGARRLELGAPECTGGCCGFLTVVVERIGGIVQWSRWELPRVSALGPDPSPLPEFHFDAGQYDAELARAEADRSWQV
ncbi:hypothetical protein ACFVFS_14235 [Kitasatospora sp. NPDC057692]|uniref:hypothetical protein n=1 Tax=Kitasatospora sp. NPDC057692 TaxID=3346215 RepID=UPI0036BBD257